MKSVLIKNIINWIISTSYEIDNIKYKEIEYALETIYISISKYIIIVSISILIGCFKNTIFSIVFMGILRGVSFGIHAKNSKVCLAVSSILILGVQFLAKIFIFSEFQKIISFIFTLVVFIRYSPSDTEKRPLINILIRKKLKIISVLIIFIYYIFIFLIKNIYLQNMLLLITLIQSFVIMPITYKIFSQNYNNHLNYNI